MLAFNGKVISLDGRLIHEVFLDTGDIVCVFGILASEPDAFCIYRMDGRDFAYGTGETGFGAFADAFAHADKLTDRLPTGGVIAATVVHGAMCGR